LNFEVIHIKGTTDILADSLSRYPIEEDNKDAEQYTPEPNSIEDADFFGYLGNIDADEYIADSQIEFRDPSKKIRLYYKVIEMTPIGEGNPSVRQDDQTNRTTLRRSKRRQTTDRTGIETDIRRNDAEPTTDTDVDAAMLDDQTTEMQNDLQTQVTPQINFESQRDDPLFAADIDYLKEGTLPSDKNMEQSVA
jgi:hypothetical protein